MTTTNTAAAISTGAFFPFSLAGLEPGDTVIVGRGPWAGGDGTIATYLGHTLDGYAAVRCEGETEIEEWAIDQVESLAVRP